MDKVFSSPQFFRELLEHRSDSRASALLLAEKVWPVVGSALQALASSVAAGEAKDPMLFLAQHMMRHKHSAIPGDWKSWADKERGKLMLQEAKAEINRVFDGFTMNKLLREGDIAKVLQAIDEEFCLEGAFRLSFNSASASDLGRESLAFEDFWPLVELKVDVLGSVWRRGEVVRAQVRSERQKAEEENRAEEREKMKKAEEAAEAVKRFDGLVSEVKRDETLRKIREEGMILTGSSYSKEANEVAVLGTHVTLLWQILRQLGFRTLNRFNRRESQIIPDFHEDNAGEKKKWSLALNRQWAAIQRTLNCRMTDGVVDGESLNALVSAAEGMGFLQLRKRVREGWEEWTASSEALDEVTNSLPKGVAIQLQGAENLESIQNHLKRVKSSFGNNKPTLETLSRRTGISMVRLNWLHKQFKALVPGQTDDYPENPGSLSREEMRELVGQLDPALTEEGLFDLKFLAIDLDGNGAVEFDEFVEWMSMDKLSFVEE